MYRAKWIKLGGNEYRPDGGVVVRVEQDLPIIGNIKAINVINGNVFIFNVTLYSTYCEKHYRAYHYWNSIHEISMTWP